MLQLTTTLADFRNVQTQIIISSHTDLYRQIRLVDMYIALLFPNIQDGSAKYVL